MLAVGHELSEVAERSQLGWIESVAGVFLQFADRVSETVFAIASVNSLCKFLQRSQESKRGTHHLKDCDRATACRGDDGRIARHAGKHRHLPKAGTGLNIAHFSMLSAFVCDKSI